MTVSALNVSAPEWAKSSSLDLTLWPSKERPDAGDFRTVLWSDFAKMLCEKFDRPKDALPMVRPAFYDHNYRDSKHFVYSDTVTLDCDEKNGVAFRLDEVADRIRKAGIRALIVTSSSYAPDGKQNFRLFVPVLSRITKNNHRATYDAINGLIGGIAAPESWNLSQGYFYGEGSDASYSPQLLWFSGETFSLAAYKGLSLGPTKGEKSKKAPSAASEGPAISGKEQLYGRVRVPVEKAGDQTGSAWLFEVARCAVTQGLDEEAFREAADAHPEAAVHVAKKGERALQRAWEAVTEGRGDYSPPVTPEDFDIVGEAVPTEKKERPKRRYLTMGDLDDLPMAFDFVEGLLYEKAMSVWAGAPKSGKSFLIVDLAHAVATGRTWAGRRTEAGPAVIYSLEGVGTLRSRMKALEVSRGPAPHLFFSPDPLRLYASKGQEPEQQIEEIIAFVRQNHVRFVVIDTLARAAAGMNESAFEEVSKVIRLLDRIKDETGAHVAIVHHSGHSRAGPRGSSDLTAAPDLVVQISREGEQRKAIITENRNGQDGVGIRFTLEEVDTGLVTRWGTPMMSRQVSIAEDCWFDDIAGTGAKEEKPDHKPTLTQIGFALLERYARFSAVKGEAITREGARDYLKQHKWAEHQKSATWKASFHHLMREDNVLRLFYEYGEKKSK